MAAQFDLIWVPSAPDIALARVTGFAESAPRKYGYRGSSSLDLWQWPVARLDDFCDAVGTFFDVRSRSPHRRTRDGTMPHVRWFDGAHPSYVAHLFAGRPAGAVAIIDVQEGARLEQQTRCLTWVQPRAEAQALNPQAKSPWQISTTSTFLGAAA
jgi:acetoacetyl-CoA synthetase